jgi:hypothetical protein
LIAEADQQSMARSTVFVVAIALFGCFMLLLNLWLSLSPSHATDSHATPQHSLLSLRANVRDRMQPSIEYLSDLRSSTGDAIKNFDDKLWNSPGGLRNVTFLPKMFPGSVAFDYNATTVYLTEQLQDLKNGTMALLETTESKLSQFFNNKNESTFLFPDPIHYNYDQFFNSHQLELFFNDTTSFLEHTAGGKLSDWFATTQQGEQPSQILAGHNTTELHHSSSVQSGLLILQNLFSSFRQKKTEGDEIVSLSPSTDVEDDKGGVLAAGCRASFPPTCRMNPYVRFWKKRFNEKDCYKSPLLSLRSSRGGEDPAGLNRYLVFQPDGGGWNNIRMAAETAMVFALASGRTLVLPPNMTFYLLNKNGNAKLDTSSFDTYFDLRKIAELVEIITMPEFLERFEKLSPKNALPSKETPQVNKCVFLCHRVIQYNYVLFYACFYYVASLWERRVEANCGIIWNKRALLEIITQDVCFSASILLMIPWP